MQRLPRQTRHQVTSVAREDAKTSHNVVDCLVAAAEVLNIHGGSVVLHVDPVRDDHRRGHDCFQHRAFFVERVIVTMQERTRVEVCVHG